MDEQQQFYWEAFFDLSTERQIGMGIGPIPRSKIIEYAYECDIVLVDDFEWFKAIISGMDQEYQSLSNSPKADNKKENEVSAADPVGTRAVFDELKKRAERVHGKKNGPT